MKIASDSFELRKTIPAEFAFGKPGDDESPIALSDNRNPHLIWSDVPEGTKSFALLCVDPDVPTVRELVNREDAVVPEDQVRGEFYHWVMVDIAPDVREIAAGSCSDGIAARGKKDPPGPKGARQGRNDYTGFFADDADMKGDYFGYDGPCPPFNDERVHRYFFRLFALDVERLDVEDGFRGGDVFTAMQGHVLAEASVHGAYAINAKARGKLPK